MTRGKLVVAIPQVNRPFLFAPDKNGDLQGYYIDFARELANELGVKVEFNRNAASFNDVVDLVAQNKADIAICHLSKTTKRAKKVLFANTDATLYQTIVANRVWLVQHDQYHRDKDDPILILQHNKPIIGITANSSYIEFAKSLFPNATLKEYPVENLFNALLHDEVDIILYDDFHVKEKLVLQPNIVLKYRIIILKSHPDLIAMAVPPGRWEFLQWINHYLEIKNINTSAEKLLEYTANH